MTKPVKSTKAPKISKAAKASTPFRLAVKRYDAKVVKKQVVFNPEKPEETALLEWLEKWVEANKQQAKLDKVKNEHTFSTLMKQLLIDHIEEEEALSKKGE